MACLGQDWWDLLTQRCEAQCSVGWFLKFLVISCQFEVLGGIVVEFLIGSSFILSFSRKYICIEVRSYKFRVDSFIYSNFFLNGLGLDFFALGWMIGHLIETQVVLRICPFSLTLFRYDNMLGFCLLFLHFMICIILILICIVLILSLKETSFLAQWRCIIMLSSYLCKRNSTFSIILSFNLFVLHFLLFFILMIFLIVTCQSPIFIVAQLQVHPSVFMSSIKAVLTVLFCAILEGVLIIQDVALCIALDHYSCYSYYMFTLPTQKSSIQAK